MPVLEPAAALDSGGTMSRWSSHRVRPRVAIDLAFGAGPMVFGLLAALGGIPFAFLAGAVVAMAGAVGAAASARRIAVAVS